jgi:hypothetical protein
VSAVSEKCHCCKVASKQRTDLKNISGYGWWSSKCSIISINVTTDVISGIQTSMVAPEDKYQPTLYYPSMSTFQCSTKA